jgi:hypothetical protein
MQMTAKFEAEGESFNACFEQLNSAFNAEFSEGGGGQDGKDGATFIPSVSAEGIISWMNDQGLPNPPPVNIKGEKGDKGEKGERGLQGIQGVQGERGADGAKGDKGDKGDRGEAGKNGTNGKDGYTPVKGVDYFDGANGKDGKDGEDGYTPVKGKDYFTDTDKQEMVNSVISAIPKYNGEVTAV